MSGRHGMVRVPIPVFPGTKSHANLYNHCLHSYLELLDEKNSPISSPNPDSKPTNSRARLSTPNHRGNHGDRKSPDKPIIRPSQRNKHQTLPGQKQAPQKKFRQIAQKAPATREWFHRASHTACSIVFYQHYNSRAACHITGTSYLIFPMRTTPSSRQ